MVVFVGKDHNITDQSEKSQVPFMLGNGVIKNCQVAVGVEIVLIVFFQIGDAKVSEFVGAVFILDGFPVSFIFLMVLQDVLVEAKKTVPSFLKNPFLNFSPVILPIGS